MSYVYRERERDRDWDEPRSSVSIKRYVVPSESSDRDRDRDFFSRHEDPADRELVIRRSTIEREDPVMVPRYDRDLDYPYEYRSERDYYDREYYSDSDRRRPIVIREQPVIIHEARGPVYVHPRDDYDVVQRSDLDRDPYYYHRRAREYDDDRRFRRELSPGDSISQATRRRDDNDYSSDDSMVYVHKTREYEDHPHHRRHLAEGALLGVGAAELLRSHRKKEGEDVGSGMGRLGRDAGAGALGAVAVNAASRARDYYRSKSRRRSHSVDDDRRSRHGHHHRHSHSHSHRGRSRSRSHSHSRARHLTEIGLGVAAIAGAAALARKKSSDGRRSRSRRRRSSMSRSEKDTDGEKRSQSQRRKHMAGAGLAGAAAAGLVEKARSHSRSGRRSRSRSHSRLRKAFPVVAAGLGTAAATGLYEKNKDKKEKERSRHRERHYSRSRSRGPSEAYPDPTRDSAGLIEYGQQPVHGSIPAADYYGRPPSEHGYFSDASDPVARDAAGFGSSRHRSQSRPRGYSDSSSDSDRASHRRRKSRHRSRSRGSPEEYAGRKDRRDRPRYDTDARQGSFDEPYQSDTPYPPPPPMGNQYYPNGNSFPPPPGSAPRPSGNGAPYSPADYPPPPGAVPPQQGHGYPPPPRAEAYPPPPRRPDGNSVRSVRGPSPQRIPRARRRTSRTASQPPQSKSVAFDIDSSERPLDPGYETDNSDTTDSPRYRRHRSRPRPRRHSSDHYYHNYPRSRHSTDHHENKIPGKSKAKPTKPQESDSDSTIDLPNRFDSQGRLLPQPGDDPLADKLENILRGVNRAFA